MKTSCTPITPFIPLQHSSLRRLCEAYISNHYTLTCALYVFFKNSSLMPSFNSAYRCASHCQQKQPMDHFHNGFHFAYDTIFYRPLIFDKHTTLYGMSLPVSSLSNSRFLCTPSSILALCYTHSFPPPPYPSRVEHHTAV